MDKVNTFPIAPKGMDILLIRPMNVAIIISLPFVTGTIGWLTNLVAIRMLFRPRNPIRLFFFSWQGLIPRRQSEIAESAGEIVEKEILSKHLVRQEISKLDIEKLIQEFVDRIVYQGLAGRLRSIPLIGGLINDTTLGMLHNMAIEEMRKESAGLVDKVATEMENRLQVKRMVTERIAEFDLDTLERVVNQVAASEFRNIELLGGVLGFAVGLLQLILLLLTGNLQIV